MMAAPYLLVVIVGTVIVRHLRADAKRTPSQKAT
jgi:hypothetical protein